jgi:hypothetical protein
MVVPAVIMSLKCTKTIVVDVLKGQRALITSKKIRNFFVFFDFF